MLQSVTVLGVRDVAQTDNGIRIISTTADGTQGNGGSGTYNGGGFLTGTDSFSISADGTKVAFMSDASNLVPATLTAPRTSSSKT